VSFECCKSGSGCCIYYYGYSPCFKCFIFFRRMLQVFHLDVSKLDHGEHMLQLCVAATAWVTAPLGVACMWARDHAAYRCCCCVCSCGRGALCRLLLLLVLRAHMLVLLLCVCMQARESEAGSDGPAYAWAWESEPFFP
jgi:hypothetical protein